MSRKLNDLFESTMAGLYREGELHPEKRRVMRLSWFAGVSSMLRLLVGPGRIRREGTYWIPASELVEYADEIHATRLEADKEAEDEREAKERADELVQKIEALMDKLSSGGPAKPAPSLAQTDPERFRHCATAILRNCDIEDCGGCKALKEVIANMDKPDNSCTTVHASEDNPEGAGSDEEMYYFGGRLCGRSELSPSNPAIQEHFEDLAALSVGESSVYQDWGGLGIAVKVTRKEGGTFRVVPYSDDEDIDFGDESVVFEASEPDPAEEPSVTAGIRSDFAIRPEWAGSEQVSKALKSLFGPGYRKRFRQL